MYRFPLQGVAVAISRACLILAAAGSLFPLAAHAGEPPPKKIVIGTKPGEIGLASWHDPSGPASARRTASERPWVGKELIAAHKTLPLGTRVRVFNLSNGRQVVVVITDRGPYRHGRIIDVSRSAAQQLGLIDSGTAHVRVQALRPGES